MIDHAKRIALLGTLTDWLSDGETWIGGFENVALDSGQHGRRIVMAFDDGQFDEAEIDRHKPPQVQYLHDTNWKYVLKLKTRSPEEALIWVLREEDAPEAA